MRKLLPLALAGAVVASLPDEASALQLDLSRPQLCSIADAVILAEVTDLETFWSEDQEGGIVRHAAIANLKTVHGQADAALTVLLPGGTIGELTQWVEDVPALRVDTRYLLFLDKVDHGWQVIGGDAGAVLITPGGWRAGETEEKAIASVGGCNAR